MEAATFSQDLTLNLKEQQIFDILKRARELRLGEDPQNQLVLRVNGGWVRDKLLGRDSIDIDISLDTLTGVQFTKYVLEAYKQISPQTCTQNKNSDVRPPAPKTEHLQTATIQLEELLVDIVNLRVETYEDGRAPTSNVFGTAEQDAFRRDITINSLFYNINEAKVEDLTGMGLSDLKKGIIRTPRDAKVLFLEDPLRIARTLKFAARFRYQIDKNILEAVADPVVYQVMKAKVSREKISKEVIAALQHPNCALFLDLALQTRLLHELLDISQDKLLDKVESTQVFTCIESNQHVWNRVTELINTQQTLLHETHLENLADLRTCLMLASLLLGLHTYKYSKKESLVEYFVKEKLKFSAGVNATVRDVLSTLQNLLDILTHPELTEYEKTDHLTLWIRNNTKVYPLALLVGLAADRTRDTVDVAMRFLVEANLLTFHSVKPVIDGNDAKDLGVQGKDTRAFLEKWLVWQARNRNATKEEAIALAKSQMKTEPKPELKD